MYSPLPHWSPSDSADLQRARDCLESPSFASRLSEFVGAPFEVAFKLMPPRWHYRIQQAAEKGIWSALNVAVIGLTGASRPCGGARYRLTAMAVGAAGGFFGASALLIESPCTAVVMLRAIAAIAAAEGEPLERMETRLACLEVLALGGQSGRGNPADTGYFGVRLALDAPLAAASRHLAERGLAGGAGSPPLVQFLAAVSQRFGVTLSQKAAAAALPVVGAASGAFVNRLFIQHFQDIARAHFALRRLERKFGAREVRARYDQLGQPSTRVLAYPLAA
ncbi:EcsC family protein [Methylolobus aquaticus]